MLTLSKIRRAARFARSSRIRFARPLTRFSVLLTLDEKDPKRLFEGNALIRRLVRVGVLDESRMKLDYVLALKVEDFLERRLQTCVYKLGLAKSIHHARVLIKQRHIRSVLCQYSHLTMLSFLQCWQANCQRAFLYCPP